MTSTDNMQRIQSRSYGAGRVQTVPGAVLGRGSRETMVDLIHDSIASITRRKRPFCTLFFHSFTTLLLQKGHHWFVFRLLGAKNLYLATEAEYSSYGSVQILVESGILESRPYNYRLLCVFRKQVAKAVY